MTQEKISGIYCIENLINNKKYIGKSIDIYSRWYKHKYELSHNSHYNRYLQHAWNKYGETNFKFYIIETCDADSLDEKEIYYIDLFNTHVYFGDGNGYNLTIGGDGIGILSEEERQIFREAQKSIPIYQIDMNGNIVKLWEYGARQASKELEINQSAIWHCIKGDRKTYKNFIWVYEKDYSTFNLKNYLNQHTQARRIKQYNTNGILIRVWDSANQIQSETGYDCSGILKVCKRKYKTYKNYIWCYENDDYITEDFIVELHSKDFICVYDLNNILIDKLNSQSDVVRKYGLNKSQVSQCLNGYVSSVKGYVLKYSA